MILGDTRVWTRGTFWSLIDRADAVGGDPRGFPLSSEAPQRGQRTIGSFFSPRGTGTGIPASECGETGCSDPASRGVFLPPTASPTEERLVTAIHLSVHQCLSREGKRALCPPWSSIQPRRRKSVSSSLEAPGWTLFLAGEVSQAWKVRRQTGAHQGTQWRAETLGPTASADGRHKFRSCSRAT